ncbi:hypothetical protein PVAP13_8NG156201 [Panicum virgatum]|uniref:Uncharacterized protein n=1 Tax=Panicum virgatum TaxID=38727 RepID=A0A8T0P9L3_PANVG|nr:hypothetical protein PVAP13_8NG156201 [Panicum virgatum]
MELPVSNLGGPNFFLAGGRVHLGAESCGGGGPAVAVDHGEARRGGGRGRAARAVGVQGAGARVGVEGRRRRSSRDGAEVRQGSARWSSRGGGGGPAVEAATGTACVVGRGVRGRAGAAAVLDSAASRGTAVMGGMAAAGDDNESEREIEMGRNRSKSQGLYREASLVLGRGNAWY